MMKKLTIILCVLLAVLCVLSSCAGGFEEFQSKRDLRKIGNAMGKLNSYEYDTEMRMTLWVGDYQVVSTASGHGVQSGINSKDYSYYESAENKTVCEELKIEDTIESLLAYVDGKTYLMNETEDHSQKLFTSMTSSQFLEYLQEQGDLPDMNEEYAHVHSVKNSDKTRTVTCSGCPAEVLDDFCKSTGLDEEQLGAKLADMEIIYTADSSYRLTKMELRCVFEKTPDKTESKTESESESESEVEARLPELTMTIRYSKFNEAERPTAPSEPEEYVEVADLRILDQIGDTIDSYRESKDATFTAESGTSVYQGTTNLSSYQEKDKVHCGENENGYFYSVEAMANGTSLQIDYANGTQTTVVNGETTETTQTEKEAKALINGLLDAIRYHKNYVSNVTKDGDGKYILQIDQLPETEYENLFSQMRGLFVRGTQTITVTVEDGKIVEVVSKVSADGKISGQSVTLYLNVTLTFQ